MNQEERRRFLIEELLWERPSCRRQETPADSERQKILLRGLMNVRHPAAISGRFLEVQDAYLQEELAAKRITKLSELSPVRNGLYLRRGDITTLECGAIVNAANSGMTGCYQPCHNCIDNCIHTYRENALPYRSDYSVINTYINCRIRWFSVLHNKTVECKNFSLQALLSFRSVRFRDIV